LSHPARVDETKALAHGLMREVLQYSGWGDSADWQRPHPKLGVHYFYPDLRLLPSYKPLKDGLLAMEGVEDKFGDAIEGPIGALVDATLTTTRRPDNLDDRTSYWWTRLLRLLTSPEFTVRTILGLAGFRSTRREFALDPSTRVVYFKGSRLSRSLPDLFECWDPTAITGNEFMIHECTGALVFDRKVPTIRDYTAHRRHIGDCIARMILLQQCLLVSGFGWLDVGPWITVLNPEFPFDTGGFVGTSRLSTFESPIFELNEAVWDRFVHAHRLLSALAREDAENVVEFREARNRFNRALARFAGTFEQGAWESAIVDLVIALESLYRPKRVGGKYQVVLAASNLLGTTESEALEVFNNLLAAYDVRNSYVHGDLTTHDEWEAFLRGTANATGLVIDRSRDPRWFAVEVVRDYVRRSILALLHLHYDHGRRLDPALIRMLVRLHLSPKSRGMLQQQAKCYPLSERPMFPS